MNLPVFISALFVLQIICLWVGGKFSKGIKNQDDYFLAGKGLKFFPLLMTFIATQIGGGTVLGASEEAYKYGWYVFLYPMGSSLGFVLLALGLGRRMYQYKVSTVAQIFEVAYRSITLKKFASFLSIVSLFMIFVGQLIASKKFMVSLGFDQDFVFIAFWAIVIVYTVLGGLQAVVATDVIQAAFFLVVFALCFGYTLIFSDFSLGTVIQGGLSGESFSLGGGKFCGWLLMPLLFMVIEQDMGQRCFAAKSGKTVALAAGVAAVCLILVCVVPIYFGVLAKTAGIEIPEGSAVLIKAASVMTDPVLGALMACAVMAAIISTADSLINAISSNVMQDFDLAFRFNKVKTAQIITILISILGIGISYFFTNVVDMLILSYELSISCLFVSVFMAMFNRNCVTSAAVLSIFFGAAGFILFRYVPMPIPKEIATIAMSCIGYGAGWLFALKNPIPIKDAVIS